MKSKLQELVEWHDGCFLRQTTEQVIAKARQLLEEEAKPTAPSGLVEELVEYIVQIHDEALPDGDIGKTGSGGRMRMAEVVKSILSRYEAKVEKQEEPLAVLADRHGYWMNINSHGGKLWRVWLGIKDHREIDFKPEMAFETPTYAAAEAKARAYLEGLDDKDDKGVMG